jgi:xanthine dehydrogenase molybdenum-binding subunit
MVPFDLIYLRPDTVEEALQVYEDLTRQRRHPAFYAGGTEILTRTRVQDAHFDSVIDLKAIPALHIHRDDDQKIQFGAALRLTEVADRNLWPLLTATADRVADHTTRGQITLGGNLLSVLPYREAVLPFLLVDSATAHVATARGVHTRRFADLWDTALNLRPGEFLVSLSVESREARAPAYRSHKMTRLDWIDYPLVTIALTRRVDGHVRAAFSGWSTYPFVSSTVNHILSDVSRSPLARAADAVSNMPMPALSDIHGSAEYRQFVTQHTLSDMLTELEESS